MKKPRIFLFRKYGSIILPLKAAGKKIRIFFVQCLTLSNCKYFTVILIFPPNHAIHNIGITLDNPYNLPAYIFLHIVRHWVPLSPSSAAETAVATA